LVWLWGGKEMTCKYKMPIALLPLFYGLFSQTLRCQDIDNSEIIFNPGLHSIWAEALVLPFPVFPAVGLGVDVDLWKTGQKESTDTRHALGIRGWYGIGTDESLVTGEKDTRAYVDIDLLMRWELDFGRLSIAFLAGYSWRDTDRWDGDYTGRRLKYGIELNDLLISPVLSIRIRVMGASFGKSHRAVELGPVAIGIALGWFNSD